MHVSLTSAGTARMLVDGMHVWVMKKNSKQFRHVYDLR